MADRAAATDFVIGVDVGTGSARAAAFGMDGRRLGIGRHPVALHRPNSVIAEQSSDDIWHSVRAAVREAFAAVPHGFTPAGLGFCATCSMVVLDSEFRPLPVGDGPAGDDPARDTIVWMDHRAEAETAAANATGAETLRYVGGALSPEMQTPKLMWLHRHRPRTFTAAGHFMDLPDFLTWRATGSLSRSICSVACKWGYLGHAARWDEALFRATGLGALADEGFVRLGTDIRPLGAPAGRLSEAAAAELGLPAGLAVGTSAIDAHAGGLGCLGLTLDGSGLDETTGNRRLALIGGTSSCHMAVAPDARFVPGVWGPYFSAMVPGLWLAEGGQSATGALIDHIIHTHPACPAPATPEAADVFAWLNGRLDALKPEGAPPATLTCGLHVYPDFHGNRSPHADPALRGMVSGLPLSATADDLARLYLATIQAIAYGTGEILAALNAAGYAIDTLIATGGGVRNPVFLREHADATGCRVVVPGEAEAVLLGAALLGAVAAGHHPSIPAAMAAMTRPGRIVEPDPAARELHEARALVHRRMREDQRAYRDIEG